MNTKTISLVLIALLFIGGLVFFASSTKKSQTGSPESLPSPTTSPIKPVMMTKTYSMEDVLLHASADDCWLLIGGKIYDATDFIGKHPGGKAIIGGCGKDATKLFYERPTNNKGPHPDAAMVQLEKLYIGDLEQ